MRALSACGLKISEGRKLVVGENLTKSLGGPAIIAARIDGRELVVDAARRNAGLGVLDTG